MNDLLNIILDFNLDYLQKLDILEYAEGLTRFLACYQLSSTLNHVRVYMAFPNDA